MQVRLKLINQMFKNNFLKKAFEQWKGEAIIAPELLKKQQVITKTYLENPGNIHREKVLRAHKSLLIIQNRQAERQFRIMAQSEAKMTVSKAIALWKINSGVQGIEG